MDQFQQFQQQSEEHNRQFQQFQQQSQAQHRYNDQQFQQQMERDAQQQFQQQMERDADAMRRRRKRAWWDLGGPAETADPSLSLETVRVKITLAEAYRGASLPAKTSHGRTIRIKIPAGVKAGSLLCLWNSDDDQDQDPVYVTIKKIVQQHPFKVRGRDLYVKVPIPRATAVHGGFVQMPPLGGGWQLEVMAGTLAGTRITLEGRGWPHCQHPGKMVITWVSPFPLNILIRAQSWLRRLRGNGKPQVIAANSR